MLATFVLKRIIEMTHILQIHQFLFNDKPFEIYGTEDEPLFLANDIICVLLETRDISNNNFFVENKNNPIFVTTLDFPGCPLAIQ